MTDSSRHGDFDLPAVEAASELITEYSVFIRKIIRYHAENEFQEEDLFQEFFLSLVRSPFPPNICNIRSYLYRAIIHVVIDATRRQVRWRSYLKKYARIKQIRITKYVSGDAFTVVEEPDFLFNHLAGYLRRKEAEAVTLRYRDGFSIAEIARKMGVKKCSVSRYLVAGLKRLRQAWAID